MTAVEHALRPEEIMEFLDGELPFERAALVRSHVASCEACRRLSEELTGVTRDLSSWRLETPPSMTAPIPPSPETFNSSESRIPWWSFLTGRTAAVYAVAAVVVIGVASRGYYREAREIFGTDSSSAKATLAKASETSRSPVEVRQGEVPQTQGVVAGQAGQLPRPVATGSAPTEGQSAPGPLIIRTARLRLLTKDFEAARQSVDRVARNVGGFMGQVDVARSGNESRLLRATLRVPAARLDETLTALRALGEVIEESQGADDVTEQVLDLDARLANARNTEKRLNDLLLKRPGELADVLAAEREVARVREEIERLEAQRKNLDRRLTYATITLQVDEERKATLSMGPLTPSARFRNALVDGFRGAFTSVLEVSLLAVRVVPVLLLWALLLAWPARLFMRRNRRLVRP
jgi:anti-sigma factor RsiW